MNYQIIRECSSRIIWVLLFLPNWDAPYVLDYINLKKFI
ncbi:hypothetical protein GXM_10157 [Nostoc sphaeroides CCNUC1]|uniref:Uncharacterized protein n=1 Tax=Nostoc sphaeroides CCNUC1 TaxID=2653204 RepID=A0A5P8WJ68_9NOSO|nr:hypothetical protein GXM_10157 [Nostoc sphaeroides CCNUC1]